MQITNGQADIFNTVFLCKYRRQQVLGPTQYGKSESLAMALLISAIIFGKKWWIVTGQQGKSDVIMGKCIDHIFDNQDLLSELEIDRTTPLERLKRERSKERLTFQSGGEIRTITADARNRRRVNDTLSGLGNEFILEDEASLIPDDLQAMVMRMLGGHNGGYLIKVGNPYNRGHFLKSWRSSKYTKIFIDYHQGLQEGRYSPEFVEEMRTEPFFDVLYECKFPDETAVDADGYYRLLTDEELSNAKASKWVEDGEKRIAFDVAEGGDDNAGIERNNKYARLVHSSKIKDLMATVQIIAKEIKERAIRHAYSFIDKNGIGAAMYSRLREMGINIVGISWGEKASVDTFANNKAEHYWRLREWVKGGGKILDQGTLDELRNIKYKEDSSGRVKIKSKEEMRKEGIPSPNRADALAMTFERTAEETAPKVITL